MSAHTWQIWRVRGAFSDSSGNEFRWGTNRTLLEAFWTVIDVNQLKNLIGFVFVEGSEPSPYLCAHKNFSLVTSIYIHFAVIPVSTLKESMRES